MSLLTDISDLAKYTFVHWDSPETIPSAKEPGSTWVALLIDGDGLSLNLSKALDEVYGLGEVVASRIYGNYHIDSRFTRWKQVYCKYGFTRRILIGVHKNIADMAIVADAVELAITVPEIDVFVIITHDGGFLPLMHKLLSLDKKVFWIGGEQPLKKAHELKSMVDSTLDKLASRNNQ